MMLERDCSERAVKSKSRRRVCGAWLIIGEVGVEAWLGEVGGVVLATLEVEPGEVGDVVLEVRRFTHSDKLKTFWLVLLKSYSLLDCTTDTLTSHSEGVGVGVWGFSSPPVNRGKFS